MLVVHTKRNCSGSKVATCLRQEQNISAVSPITRECIQTTLWMCMNTSMFEHALYRRHTRLRTYFYSGNTGYQLQQATDPYQESDQSQTSGVGGHVWQPRRLVNRWEHYRFGVLLRHPGGVYLNLLLGKTWYLLTAASPSSACVRSGYGSVELISKSVPYRRSLPAPSVATSQATIP
jgi:hypothetical protein